MLNTIRYLIIAVATLLCFKVIADGALAIDKFGGLHQGYSMNYPTQSAADKEAISQCEFASNVTCKIIKRFKNSCVGYAEDAKQYSNKFGLVETTTVARAIDESLGVCLNKGGRYCTMRLQACDKDKKKKDIKINTDLFGQLFGENKQQVPNNQNNKTPTPGTKEQCFSGIKTNGWIPLSKTYPQFTQCSQMCGPLENQAFSICGGRGATQRQPNQCNENGRSPFCKVTYQCVGAASQCMSKTKAKASLMIVLDTSGSMGSNSRLVNSKKAAKESISKAVSDNVEVALMTFAGGCNSPISREHQFSLNKASLFSFVDSLVAGGGTPLGTALPIINKYMDKNKSQSSQKQMILLMADGDNACGDIQQELSKLKRNGLLFRHETIGLEVASGSGAAKDLNDIAKQSGGSYHRAARSQDIGKVFSNAMETMQMLDMLGQFGN
jgi:uncharacterized protein YegL